MCFSAGVLALGQSPSWTAESGQGYEEFGWSVASAGDVNGDGYSDVIVGAHLYDNSFIDEGRAFVYTGSASGLSATPTWIANGNHGNADFGYSVASAGDIDGDGFADIVIGARLDFNGQTSEGRAYVYRGSPSRARQLDGVGAGNERILRLLWSFSRLGR